jgi:hypothetical protein
VNRLKTNGLLGDTDSDILVHFAGASLYQSLLALADRNGKNGSSRMDFDPTVMIRSLIPSGLGWVLFRYVRKADRWPQLVGGLVLMPYFTPTATSLTGVGLFVGGGLLLVIRAGW